MRKIANGHMRLVVGCLAGLLFLAGFWNRAFAWEDLRVPDEVVRAYPDVPEEERKVAWFASRYLLDRQYAEAISVLEDYQKRQPTRPFSTMALMFAYHVRMLENFDFRYRESFEKAAAENERVIQTYFREKKATQWDLLMVGASVGLRGMHEARQKSWLRAASLGFRANQYLKKIVDDAEQKDKKSPPGSIYEDVYYGLGMYHYFVSWAQEKSLILSAFPDRRKLGLEELERCAKRAPLTGPMAAFALAYIYGMQGDLVRAHEWAFQVVAKYPKNIIFRSYSARLAMQMGYVDGAVADFEGILKENPDAIYLNYYLARGLQHRERDPERVRKLLEDFLQEKDVARADEQRSDAAFRVAQLWAAKGEWAKARQYLKLVRPNLLSPAERKRHDEFRRSIKS